MSPPYILILYLSMFLIFFCLKSYLYWKRIKDLEKDRDWWYYQYRKARQEYLEDIEYWE